MKSYDKTENSVWLKATADCSEGIRPQWYIFKVDDNDISSISNNYNVCI